MLEVFRLFRLVRPSLQVRALSICVQSYHRIATLVIAQIIRLASNPAMCMCSLHIDRKAFRSMAPRPMFQIIDLQVHKTSREQHNTVHLFAPRAAFRLKHRG